MKNSFCEFTGFAKLAAISAICILLLSLLTGCETPEGSAAAGHIFNANAALASNPQQAAGWGLLGAIAASGAQMQHEKEVAEAGRTQIQINQSPTAEVKATYVDKQRFENGCVYTGPIEWFEPNRYRASGRGYVENLKGSGGDVYSGYVYANGVQWIRDGQGKTIWPDGQKYEGEWKDDKYHGQGTAISASANKYEGEFKYGNREGQGTLTLANGKTLSGEFRNNKLYNGVVSIREDTKFSKTTWKAGSTQQIENGVSTQSDGTQVWADGTAFTGTWDFKSGRSGGTISWPDGRIYKGSWRIVRGEPDLPEGKGEMTWPDGRKYVGEFKDGKMHGSGKMTYTDGKTEDGMWQEDKFVGTQPSSIAIGQNAGAKSGFVNVAATDESFEVFADSAFVGNTPAKLKLSEGAHVIEVKKAGFKDYRKEIKVLEDSELTIRAVLDKN